MRVLYVNSGGVDYLQDLLRSGLRKLLGRDLIDWGWNKRYHLPFWSHPENMGYAGPCSPTLKDFSKHGDIDAVVIGACKKEALERYLKIQKFIPKRTKVIFIDGGDEPELGGDLRRESAFHLLHEMMTYREPDLLFKRELLDDIEQPAVKPLPMAFNLSAAESLRKVKKQYKVAFWAVESHPIRTQALAILETQFDCKENGTIRGQLFSKYHRKGQRYLEELAACQIVLNFRGAGWDTLRYWEAPAIGSLLVSQKPQIVIPNDFVHGEEVIHIGVDFQEMLDVCRHYLINADKAEEITKNAHAKLKKFHTDVARADNVLRELAQIL